MSIWGFRNRLWDFKTPKNSWRRQRHYSLWGICGRPAQQSRAGHVTWQTWGTAARCGHVVWWAGLWAHGQSICACESLSPGLWGSGGNPTISWASVEHMGLTQGVNTRGQQMGVNTWGQHMGVNTRGSTQGVNTRSWHRSISLKERRQEPTKVYHTTGTI